MPHAIISMMVWALLEEVKHSAQTPLWVPITIFVLILLMFLWGLTRGNVKDENLPDLGDLIDHAGNHDSVE